MTNDHFEYGFARVLLCLKCELDRIQGPALYVGAGSVVRVYADPLRPSVVVVRMVHNGTSYRQDFTSSDFPYFVKVLSPLELLAREA